ncbi:MAG: reprolysin-like metallopeptidase [Candidatus Competibacter sp.]
MNKSPSHQNSPSKFSQINWIHLTYVGMIVVLMVMAKSSFASSVADRTDHSISATEAIPDLLAFDENRPRYKPSKLSAPRVGRHAMNLNPQMRDLTSPPKAVHFLLPIGSRYEVVQDNQMTHCSGNVTWVGYLKDYGNDYRALITTGQGRSFGQILTPDGEFLVESDESGTWLIDAQAAGLTPGDLMNDAIPSPFDRETTDPIQPYSRSLARQMNNPLEAMANFTVQPQAASNTTIDVMLLYTAGMANRYGAGLLTRLDNLIAIANQAYLDSQILITLRLVRTAQVNYSDTTDNSTALNALTYGSDSGLASVKSVQDQYSADLVVLLRPLSNANHGSCGMAWINGYNGQSVSLGKESGYAVVSDGRDVGGSNYYCLDLTLTHELGHNMGSVHDRANASFQGAFPYSYGYGQSGTYGTVMSYINPRIGKFSNPNITCASGIACGTANDDNARSLNSTRADVANFRSTQIATSDALKLAGLTGAGTIFYTTSLSAWTNVPGQLRRLIAADLDGNGTADLAGLNGAGTIYYTLDRRTWTNVPGQLSQLVAADLDGNGAADLAGLNGAGTIFYTTNLSAWINILGQLTVLSGR